MKEGIRLVKTKGILSTSKKVSEKTEMKRIVRPVAKGKSQAGKRALQRRPFTASASHTIDRLQNFN